MKYKTPSESEGRQFSKVFWKHVDSRVNYAEGHGLGWALATTLDLISRGFILD